jgi:hypothetical protein
VVYCTYNSKPELTVDIGKPLREIDVVPQRQREEVPMPSDIPSKAVPQEVPVEVPAGA